SGRRHGQSQRPLSDTCPGIIMASDGSDVVLFLEDLVDFYLRNMREVDLSELFEVIRELGSGTFGSVLMVKDRKTARMMALKMLDRSRTCQSNFIREFSVSFFLSSHPNIIGGYGLAFRFKHHYAFAQELSPIGDLHSLIPVNVRLPEAVVKRCAVQIASALDFMKSKGLVHLDIKPENILVFDRECCQLISCKTGSKSYKSPELCQETSMEILAADPRIDVWAFGVVLFLLMTGMFPWEDATLEDRKYRRFVRWQKASPSKFTPFPWKKLPSLHSMFHNLLAVDITVRGDATDVLAYMDLLWKNKVSQKARRRVGTKRKRMDLHPE
uniref:Protein kinase domain-containing protein n=1 Tax=Leptobrachium leishanense TaxID=445787 RepID=A0A8C5LS89_9ANUR